MGLWTTEIEGKIKRRRAAMICKGDRCGQLENEEGVTGCPCDMEYAQERGLAHQLTASEKRKDCGNWPSQPWNLASAMKITSYIARPWNGLGAAIKQFFMAIAPDL